MSLFRKTFHDHTEEKADGRNIAPEKGVLEGEAADQYVKRVEEPFPTPGVTHVEPVHATAAQARPSYYGRPLVKEPVWIWSIPTYFYVGGVAGAAVTMAAAVQLRRDESLRPFVRKLRWLGTGAAGLGSALLIYDLGRPSRFLNMLRVFRPTSPMSMGAWLLATMAPLAGASALLSRGPKPIRAVGDVAGLGATLVGMPFTGYTAVLIANTAVPVWQSARKALPALFITSSMSSLASATEFMDLGPRERRMVRRFGAVGKVAEIVTSEWMHREIAIPEVKRPLQEGLPGKLLKFSKAATLASLGISMLPNRFKSAHKLGGLLGSASVLAMKWGVFLAGRPSSRNPHATFEMQHKGRGAAEIGRGSNLVQLKVEGQPLPSKAPVGEGAVFGAPMPTPLPS